MKNKKNYIFKPTETSTPEKLRKIDPFETDISMINWKPHIIGDILVHNISDNSILTNPNLVLSESEAKIIQAQAQTSIQANLQVLPKQLINKKPEAKIKASSKSDNLILINPNIVLSNSKAKIYQAQAQTSIKANLQVLPDQLTHMEPKAKTEASRQCLAS